MRKPGIIRCKDCLAWEDRKHCKVTPPKEAMIGRDWDLDSPKTPPDWYCLQAVPREPGTCEDCCYGAKPIIDPDRIEATYKEEFKWSCHYEREHSFTNKDHTCRHWWPCAVIETDNDR